MKTICIESPLAGDFVTNIEYAKVALCYCLDNSVSPYASHLLITQVFDDLNSIQREAGIAAGLAMGDQCDERWYFIDLGWSNGMLRARSQKKDSQPELIITLGGDWREKYSCNPTPGMGHRM